MPTWIALLRAVNVGGLTVKMADLKAMASGLGLENPRTLLASGNLLFEADGTAAALTGTLEAAAEARFGTAIDFILRTPAEIAATIAANPFPDEARDGPTFLHVGFGKAAPDATALAAIDAAIAGLPEKVRVIGREMYVFYTNGAGRSKLTPALQKVERRHPSIRATSRNWNTVLKLAAAAA